MMDFMPSENATQAIFVARGLTKTYRMGDVEVPALRSIDLQLYRGELVVLLGPSGSGKSTLLNILGGLDAPTSGEVYYLDHKLTGASEADLTRFRREHVGFVFQFYNLIPSLTARENVAAVTEIAKSPMQPEEALQLVGWATGLTISPPSCRGANSSVWRSPAPWPRIPRCCCATSRPGRSIRPPVSWCLRCWKW